MPLKTVPWVRHARRVMALNPLFFEWFYRNDPDFAVKIGSAALNLENLAYVAGVRISQRGYLWPENR